MLLPILEPGINKKYKIIYIYIYISVRRVYYNAQKIVEKWLRRIIYEIKKFNSVFFTDKSSISKENSI